jgi:hypothetical protein
MILPEYYALIFFLHSLSFADQIIPDEKKICIDALLDFSHDVDIDFRGRPGCSKGHGQGRYLHHEQMRRMADV